MRCQNCGNEWASWRTTCDVLEPIWTNGLSQTNSNQTGDLVDELTPMFCEYIDDEGNPRGDYWVYLGYAVRDPQDDLLDKGFCEFEYARNLGQG